MAAEQPARQVDERPPLVLDDVRRIASFLSRVALFSDLSRHKREQIAAAIEKWSLGPGATLLVAGGPPGTRLFVVFDGILELTTAGQVIDVVTSGGVVGIPTLVTGRAPEMTVRARDQATLFAIPRDVAIEVLSRPQGLAFVAGTLLERLVRTARMIESRSEKSGVPVSSLIHRPAVICDPDTPAREAAQTMSDEVVSAVLVKTREGLGIVSNADIRDKIVAASASPETPLSAIMSQPVLTIGDDQTASEASIEMMRAGVNHLAVVDSRGHVLGVVSAASLMSPDALTPLTLRWSIAAAHDVEEVVEAAKLLPQVFLSLVDSRLDAATVSRLITLQQDALTQRLLELAIERHGPPPTTFAWLALGSGGRGELTLASDQDNALVYADAEGAEIDAYFERVGADVNRDLARCGFELDQSGVLASDHHWRMSLSDWVRVFKGTYEVWDLQHTLRASVAFDLRKVTGDLDIGPIVEVLLTVRDHPSLLNRIARTVTDIRSPLGFRQRLTGPLDIKKSALLPIENMARYYALANRVTVSATLDRLAAVQELGGFGATTVASLPEAFMAVWSLRLGHHANAVRHGRRLDDAIDSTTLRPLTYAELQEALRVIAAAQKRIPEIVMPGDMERMA